MSIALQIPKNFNSTESQEYFCRMALEIASLHSNTPPFVIVQDKQSLSAAFAISENVIFIRSRTYGVLGHFFYKSKLYNWIKKQHPGYFLSQGAIDISHLLPRHIIIINSPEILNNNRQLKNIVTAHAVITSSALLTEKLIDRIKKFGNNIFHVPYLYNTNVQKITQEEKIAIQHELFEEKEFFILFQCGAPLHHIITFLKGFSIFKKWQQSNIQILLIIDHSSEEAISSVLDTYKFREDVKIISQKFYQKKWIEASYATFVLPSVETPISTMHQVIEANMPLAVNDNAYLRSAFGNAACYFKMEDNSIGLQLIQLYKNESFRNELILQAISLSSNLHRPSAVEIFKKL